jgi:hypothetical protein
MAKTSHTHPTSQNTTCFPSVCPAQAWNNNQKYISQVKTYRSSQKWKRCSLYQNVQFILHCLSHHSPDTGQFYHVSWRLLDPWTVCCLGTRLSPPHHHGHQPGFHTSAARLKGLPQGSEHWLHQADGSERVEVRTAQSGAWIHPFEGLYDLMNLEMIDNSGQKKKKDAYNDYLKKYPKNAVNWCKFFLWQ